MVMDHSRKAIPDPLQIRLLQSADLVHADRLRALAGWNQTRADWVRFMEYEPSGCFLAEWEGQPVGTVTTTSYGSDLAWIGMMLVDPDYRRRGIASALMQQAIAYLDNEGVKCIKLDATPEGMMVYEKLGFTAEWELHRWEANPTGDASVAFARETFPDQIDWDAQIFGARRLRWLGRLADRSAIVSVAHDEVGKVTAFGMAREGMRANYIGPIVASDEAGGLLIAGKILRRIRGRSFWDLPDANTSAAELAKDSGFRPVRHLIRMWRGKANVSSQPLLQFGITDPAAG
ncbi:MAG: GNAT superfamily N-acetyltransferase [Limisphaerales bacterium]|jgi:GNAT superfamily N-acetyltransferase